MVFTFPAIRIDRSHEQHNMFVVDALVDFNDDSGTDFRYQMEFLCYLADGEYGALELSSVDNAFSNDELGFDPDGLRFVADNIETLLKEATKAAKDAPDKEVINDGCCGGCGNDEIEENDPRIESLANWMSNAAKLKNMTVYIV